MHVKYLVHNNIHGFLPSLFSLATSPLEARGLEGPILSCDPFPHVPYNDQSVSFHFAGLNCGEYQGSLWSQPPGLAKFLYWEYEYVPVRSQKQYTITCF